MCSMRATLDALRGTSCVRAPDAERTPEIARVRPALAVGFDEDQQRQATRLLLRGRSHSTPRFAPAIANRAKRQRPRRVRRCCTSSELVADDIVLGAFAGRDRSAQHPATVPGPEGPQADAANQAVPTTHAPAAADG